MVQNNPLVSRRSFMAQTLAGLACASAMQPLTAIAQQAAQTGIITRKIPSSGQSIPAIGMGTWITFNVALDEKLMDQRARIMDIFFNRGGSLIDCSPMYGTSAATIGHGLEKLGKPPVFSASKVWVWDAAEGPAQMEQQRKQWGIEKFNLMQVHNLLNWQEHLARLKDYKAKGWINYTGVTTSHGSRHSEMVKVIRSEKPDFAQFSYNIANRAAEKHLLPTAADNGVGVIVNRPFMHKKLFDMFAHKPLPEWAGEEAGAKNWAEFFLKFVISHPAVTCAIPATSQIPHIKENMGALYGQLPDEKTRTRMIDYIEAL